MTRIKTILALLVAASILSIGLKTYAQPNIPKEKIPSDIPAYMKEQIEGLYSSHPVERANATVRLREFSSQSLKPAIPFLFDMLHDDAHLMPVYPLVHILGTSQIATSPGEEAAKTLGKIGKPVVESLTAALKDKNSYKRKCRCV